MKISHQAWLCAGVLAVCLAGGARAEDPSQVKAEVYRMWDVDSMILQAADNVARRYNLNAAQTEYTRKIMMERVTRFLEENQEQIWPLVRDLARHQLSGSPPDENTAKRIGGAALPLVEKAKKAILDGNREWGSILTEEQKRLHEYDLQEMQGTFDKVFHNFQQWQSGKPTPNPMFPEYVQKDNEPPTPPQPPTRYASLERKQKNQEAAWTRYVKDFIRKYNLDPSQREAAESILREMKERLNKHRENNRDKYAEVDKRLKGAFDAGDLKRQAAVEREEAALERPVKDMFDELVSRLERILTPAQKERHEQALAGKRSRGARAAGPTTRPAIPLVPATQNAQNAAPVPPGDEPTTD